MKRFLIALAALLWLLPASARKKTKAEQPVQTNREYWVEQAYRMARPVLSNLAAGTLHEKMPIEQFDNAGRAPYAHLEAVGRLLCGLSPWFEVSGDSIPAAEAAKRDELLAWAHAGLRHAVDPDSPDRLNFTRQAQPIVDAAYLAHAFLRAPKALWEPLDSLTKRRYVEAFKALRNRTGAYNNWLLFAGLTEAFLLKQGEEADPFRFTLAKNKLKEWYVGDGWYSDGSKFSMDYYNSYVMHPMMVAMLETLAAKGRASKQECEQAMRRMVRHADYCERIIGPDGHYPAFGRSVTYRSAAFQSLADAALRHMLPEHVSPAQVRCLVLGFNGHQPGIADYYTSTGSLYMATLSFLPLGLPADDPFWTDAPAPWTAQKAWGGEPFQKDYKVEY